MHARHDVFPFTDVKPATPVFSLPHSHCASLKGRPGSRHLCRLFLTVKVPDFVVRVFRENAERVYVCAYVCVYVFVQRVLCPPQLIDPAVREKVHARA